jgi:chorismate synthase
VRETNMAGNSFGRVFRVTTYGESHGRAVGVVVDGAVPGVPLSEEDVQVELDRRRPGQSALTTPRSEKDRAEILSGIFEGKTTGTPVSIVIRNEAMDSSEYEAFRHLYRPGHADYGYEVKYGVRDWRGSGRASGRETAGRVAGGAVAKKTLREAGIGIAGFALEIGGVRGDTVDLGAVEKNPARAADPGAAPRMAREIERARAEGDSLGGIAEIWVEGCPPGLGDPVFDKLGALLAHAVMSVGAVKGFEIGSGFEAARMRGSAYNDPFTRDGGRVGTRTNNAGGILGGISTGERIVLRAAVRPPASIAKPQQTVGPAAGEETLRIEGRHDPCIVPRVIPVLEAMVAIALLDCLLVQGMYERFRR